MTRRVRGLSVSLAALVILLGAVPRAAEASLIGDSVTCTSTDFTCVPPSTTVGAGSEFVLDFFFPQFSVDLDASSITLTYLLEPSLFGSPFIVTFGDLDSSAGDIVDVGLVTSGLLVDLDVSALSFTAHSVTINVEGSVWLTGGTATIPLTFATVPVPATLLLVGAGLVGVGAWRRRRAV